LFSEGRKGRIQKNQGEVPKKKEVKEQQEHLGMGCDDFGWAGE